MKLINEINTIKNLMNLNEVGPGAWLDEVWKVTKGVLGRFSIKRSSLEPFIRNGFDAQEFKLLEKSILESPNGQLGVELKNSLTTAKNSLPPTATAEKLIIETRIKQIDDLITQSSKALKYGEFVGQLKSKLDNFTEKNRWTIAKDKDLLTKVNSMKKVIQKLETNEGKEIFEKISGTDVDELVQLAKNRFPSTFQKISGKYSQSPNWLKYSAIAFIIFAGVSCSKQKNCKALKSLLSTVGGTIKNLFGMTWDLIDDNSNEDPDNGDDNIVVPD